MMPAIRGPYLSHGPRIRLKPRLKSPRLSAGMIETPHHKILMGLVFVWAALPISKTSFPVLRLYDVAVVGINAVVKKRCCPIMESFAPIIRKVISILRSLRAELAIFSHAY